MGWLTNWREDRRWRSDSAATDRALTQMSDRLEEGDPVGAALGVQAHAEWLITSGADEGHLDFTYEQAGNATAPYLGSRKAWVFVEEGDSWDGGTGPGSGDEGW